MPKTLLLLGSGELGQMLAKTAKKYDLYTVALGTYPNAPAMQVADDSEIVDLGDEKALKKAVLKYKPQFVVPEIETINIEILNFFESEGIQVCPSAYAIKKSLNKSSLLKLAQKDLNLNTPRFFSVSSLDELFLAAKRLGYPCVSKPLISSSGRGQSIIRDETEVESAWNNAKRGRVKGNRIIVEEYISFEREISLLTVTQENRQTLFCPPIGQKRERGDYVSSWQPAMCSEDQLLEMQRIAKAITEALGGCGLWGVEFFLTNEKVYLSEVAPRPHSTGLVTLAGTQNYDQFDLHLRAMIGLEIESITLERQGASNVILTESAGTNPKVDGLEMVQEEEHIQIELFSKPETRPYRRMGVALASDSLEGDIEATTKRAQEAASRIRVI